MRKMQQAARIKTAKNRRVGQSTIRTQALAALMSQSVVCCLLTPLFGTGLVLLSGNKKTGS